MVAFFVSFLLFFTMFFVNELLVLAKDLVAKQIRIRYVIRLMFLSFPLIMSYSFPFGTLVGALISIGRFKTDFEIVAMQACGISASGVFLPLAIRWVFLDNHLFCFK